MYDVKQFKLISGEEVICEVVEWAANDNPDMVVRRCFKIHTAFDNEGIRYHSFRPYMALQEGPEMFITINTNHVCSEGNPDLSLVQHYREAVKASEMTEKEVEEKLESMVKRMKELSGEFDDSSDNLIRFPSKPRLH